MPSTSMEVLCGVSGKGGDDGAGEGTEGGRGDVRAGQHRKPCHVRRGMVQERGLPGRGLLAGGVPGLPWASEPSREDDTLSGAAPISAAGGTAKDMRTGQWNDGM